MILNAPVSLVVMFCLLCKYVSNGIIAPVVNVQVLYDPQELTEGQITEVIEDAGFEASILRDYDSQPVLQVNLHPLCFIRQAASCP